MAANVNPEAGQVLAFKGARISDYGGKSLNAADDHAQCFLEPPHERTRQLQHWYKEIGYKTELQPLTMKQGRGDREPQQQA